MKCLGHEVKISEAIPATGSATGDVNGNVIDVSNYTSINCTAQFGTGNAANGLKAQQGDLLNGSDMSDLEGSEVLGANGEGIVSLDVVKPQKRYVRFVAIRGVASTVDAAFANRYGGRTFPTNNNDGSTIVHEQVISPAEGTP